MKFLSKAGFRFALLVCIAAALTTTGLQADEGDPPDWPEKTPAEIAADKAAFDAWIASMKASMAELTEEVENEIAELEEQTVDAALAKHGFTDSDGNPYPKPLVGDFETHAEYAAAYQAWFAAVLAWFAGI
jgi:hypothetical protein